MKEPKIILCTVMVAMWLPAVAINTKTGSGTAAGMGRQEPYKVVWQDLFNGTTLNTDRWNIEVNGAGGGNNELQYYRAENVSVGDDGEGNNCLILTARREEYKGKHFTSGRINSLNNIAFTHGKIEAAIKLPQTANGLWPAFWMMGNDYSEVGWPKCGETDIMEFGHADGIKAGTQDRYFNGACHWGQGWPAASYANSVTRGYSLQDGDFHIFTCIWDEGEVRMYVDLDQNEMQNPYYRMTMPCDDPDNEWSPGNYFHKLNFILFNLAVGGDFTGIHDASKITALNEENGNEASMYVDWVKIYQKGSEREDTMFYDDGDPLENSSVGAITTKTCIHCNGRNIVSNEPGIKVYDISGRLCICSCTNSVNLDSVSNGIYVVQSGDATIKIEK